VSGSEKRGVKIRGFNGVKIGILVRRLSFKRAEIFFLNFLRENLKKIRKISRSSFLNNIQSTFERKIKLLFVKKIR